jgi:inner membrane protein
MDNLTHALVGATIAKAGAERATPLATATLIVAANAPDVDVFAYTHGEYFALSFRRGITHGLPAMTVLPFVVAAVMLSWDRWVRRRRDPGAEPARPGAILLLSVIGLLTHPTLDWMNTYGMRWLLPFDGSWTYGDALFIIDPWLWLGLGGAIFLSTSREWGARIGWGTLGLVATLVILASPLPLGTGVRVMWVLGVAAIVGTASTGRPASAAGRRRVVIVAGAAAALYVSGMVSADLLARRAVMRAAQSAGMTVTDLMVSPTPANPFVAEVEIRTSDAFVPGVHRWLGSPRIELFPERSVALRAGPDGMTDIELDRIVSAAEDVPDAHYWLEWSRYPYVRVASREGGWYVTFRDARYDGQEGAGGLTGVRVYVSGP